MRKKSNKLTAIVLFLYLSIFVIFIVYHSLTWEYDLLSEPENWSVIRKIDTGAVELLNFTSSQGRLNLRFSFLDTNENNYCGMIYKPKGGKSFDISKYDRLNIEVDSFTVSFISCILNTEAEMAVPYVSGEKGIYLTNDTPNHSIELKKIEVAHWWNWYSGIPKERTPPIDLSSVFSIKLGIPKLKRISLHEPAEYVVTSVILKRDIVKIFIRGFILILPLLISVFYTLILKRIKRIIFTNNPEKVDLIETFIGEHFANTECNITKVSSSLHISPEKVEEFCQKRLKCSFKEYLTTIRIAEAERLLKNTDLQIKEIASLVGYNHVTAFNRDFKKSCGIPPGEFR